jgi:hypothetical protein
MAKYIETKDGSRMLVSDDTPDELTEEVTVAAPVVLIPVPQVQNNSVGAVAVQLIFTDPAFPALPVRCTKCVATPTQVKVKGTMLLDDYAWLLEHISGRVSGLVLVTAEEKTYMAATGPFYIIQVAAKDINATTVNVHLSLSLHI